MATSNKTLPIVVIGIAVLAAVFYFGSSMQTDNGDVAGTVAPAQRYQAEQPTAEEIQLGDEGLQEVLQSDTFARLVADEAFQAAMDNLDFQALLASPEFARIGASRSAFEALTGELAESLRSPAARQALSSEAVMEAFNIDALRVFAGNQAYADALFSGAGKGLTTERAIFEALGEEAFREELMRNAEALRGAGDAENFMSTLKGAFQGEAYKEALSSAELFAAAENRALREMLVSSEFLKVAADLRAMEALRKPEVAEAFASADFLRIARNKAAFDALNIEELRGNADRLSVLAGALADERFGAVWNSPAFTEALGFERLRESFDNARMMEALRTEIDALRGGEIQ